MYLIFDLSRAELKLLPVLVPGRNMLYTATELVCIWKG